MFDLEWTLGRSRALRQLVPRLPAHIISTALLLVTRFAEVGVAPTEPLSHITAELAFKLDEIRAVLGTRGIASAKGHCSALTTDQVLLFERVVVVLRRFTVLHTAEVRIATLEAHVVGEPLHGVSLQVVVVWVALPAQSRIFMQVLELGSF